MRVLLMVLNNVLLLDNIKEKILSVFCTVIET